MRPQVQQRRGVRRCSPGGDETESWRPAATANVSWGAPTVTSTPLATRSISRSPMRSDRVPTFIRSRAPSGRPLTNLASSRESGTGPLINSAASPRSA